MVKRQTSMDGFVPRRTNRQVGSAAQSSEKPAAGVKRPEQRVLTTATDLAERPRSLSRSEIDDSLRDIDQPDESTKKRRKDPAARSKRRKWIKRVILLLIVITIAIGGYVFVKGLIASSNVFKGSIFDVFQNQPLKQDDNGRSNILILGTSEDDPGHQGANLTDSMMILSIDQTKKNAYMISIPRDMEVKYGQACTSGYAGKINVYYSCVHEGEGTDADRAALSKSADFVGKIFGLDIQYGVNVNYTVMRELVNAVGGSITVTIDSRDPRGQMDSNFDWKCGVGDWKVSHAQVLKRCPPHGHFIDYPNGPVTLDAEHALYLAQARGDSAPTYGFEQSNFDREKNQQKIIKALREKAVSAGTLSDFGKVTGIIDALGNNLRTTFETKELRTLVSLAQGIQSDSIKSISLIDGDNPVMNGDGNPSAGKYEFDDIRAFVKKNLSSDPVEQEAAAIDIYNATGTAGVAQTESDKLKAKNFTVGTIGNAPTGDYGHYTIYQIDKSKTGTAAKLKELYGVTPLTTDPPVAVGKNTKFILIIGVAPANTSNGN